MLPFSVVLLQQIHCYAIWLLRYYGNATDSLLHNRNYYVTMEMQYNALSHNRNYYVTMEMQYNSLSHNRNCYVTTEMQYNSLSHNRNYYVTMEMPSRPNISQ
jgi:hypothetical protein